MNRYCCLIHSQCFVKCIKFYFYPFHLITSLTKGTQGQEGFGLPDFRAVCEHDFILPIQWFFCMLYVPCFARSLSVANVLKMKSSDITKQRRICAGTQVQIILSLSFSFSSQRLKKQQKQLDDKDLNAVITSPISRVPCDRSGFKKWQIANI